MFMLVKVGQVGHLHNVIGGFTPPEFSPALLAPLLLLDGDVDSSPSKWENASALWPDVFQSVSSNQPVINAGAVEFDGSNDFMLGGYYTDGAKVAQTLPDGAGSDAGRGITCTGLAFDATTDTFWIANHGQALGSDPFTPSIMNVSKDGATKITELVLTAQFPAMSSIQGVSVDTSDGTLWLVSKDENLLRHISKTGDDLGTISAGSGANGLAYDGRVRAYSIGNDVLSDQIRLPESLAIEGLYLDGAYLYIADDGYFHNGTLNQLHRYAFDSANIRAVITGDYDALEFNMVVKFGGTAATSETILALGNPLSGRGFGVFLIGGTNNQIRIMMNDGIVPSQQVDVVCAAALTAYSIITLKADFANRTISLYQNGVLQGAGSYSAAMHNALFYGALSIAGLPDGTRTPHIDFKEICITDYLLGAGQNNNLGDYYAQEHGLPWFDL
tara:strand:+ start:2173 stop:3504 length:1332 start_codon:yes stop_codon:yes gene_type:complete